MFEDKPRKQRIFLITSLFMPLVLCLGLLAFIKIGQNAAVSPETAIRLSPFVNNNSLVIGLIIFTCGYVFFLGMMFSEDIKCFIENYGRKRRNRI